MVDDDEPSDAWLSQWRNDHRELATFAQLIDAFNRRFARRAFSWIPYLTQEYLDGNTRAVQRERELLERGRIKPSAFRYIGRCRLGWDGSGPAPLTHGLRHPSSLCAASPQPSARALLVRASDHVTDATIQGSRDWFSDDDGNPHEQNINKAAEAGFTGGTASGGYNPGGVVSRAQMASFLARVLDLLVEAGFAATPEDEPAAAPNVTITRVLADPEGDDVAHDAGEYVGVRNDSNASVSLDGWYLVDDANRRLDWCAISVAPGATARLYTGTGDDGSDHCHAGSGSAVWNNTGDTARLYAPDGTLIDSHTY